MVQKENIIARSINYSFSYTAIDNVLGKSPRFKHSDWEKMKVKNCYPLNRNCNWINNAGKNSLSNLREKNIEKSVSLNNLKNLEKIKHSDIKTISNINAPLWDKCEWRSIGFGYSPSTPEIPILTLGFINIEAGVKIFDEWISEFGNYDKTDQLRISIITGINKKFPNHYKVLITSNPFNDISGKSFYVPARFITMNSNSPEHFDRFLKLLEVNKKYLLVPSKINIETQSTEIIEGHALLKDNLIVKNAWEIEEHSLESIVIQKDDNPIIPEAISNPPVLNILRKFN
ncbi:MAG: hypothetical protein WAT71_10640 [Ignavibacteria bacterium]